MTAGLWPDTSREVLYVLDDRGSALGNRTRPTGANRSD